MQIQITPRHVIKEETKELGEKPDPLDNQLGYMGKQETL